MPAVAADADDEASVDVDATDPAPGVAFATGDLDEWGGGVAGAGEDVFAVLVAAAKDASARSMSETSDDSDVNRPVLPKRPPLASDDDDVTAVIKAASPP